MRATLSPVSMWKWRMGPVWLMGLAVGACASDGSQVLAGPSPETGGPTGFQETIAEVEPEVNESALTAKEGEPDPAEKARKKLIEEYKALALKNDCSRGKTDMAGTWRFAGESKTPDYSATITISGTKYVEKIGGRPDGKRVDATLTGEIRCLFKNRVLVQLDKVVPEGAYGNTSGDMYPCDVLSDMDPNVDKMLMSCYFEWDLRPSMAMDFEFERVEGK
jgi:hypothetical protein